MMRIALIVLIGLASGCIDLGIDRQATADLNAAHEHQFGPLPVNVKLVAHAGLGSPFAVWIPGQGYTLTVHNWTGVPWNVQGDIDRRIALFWSQYEAEKILAMFVVDPKTHRATPHPVLWLDAQLTDGLGPVSGPRCLAGAGHAMFYPLPAK